MNVCAICRSDNRPSIDSALLKGDSVRNVAAAFGLSASQVQRHKKKCLAEAVIEARKAGLESFEDVYKRMSRRRVHIEDLVEKAANAGDLRNAVALLAEARKHDEVLLRLGQQPGYREESSPSQTLNFPDARIIVTQGPAPALLEAKKK